MRYFEFGCRPYSEFLTINLGIVTDVDGKGRRVEQECFDMTGQLNARMVGQTFLSAINRVRQEVRLGLQPIKQFIAVAVAQDRQTFYDEDGSLSARRTHANQRCAHRRNIIRCG